MGQAVQIPLPIHTPLDHAGVLHPHGSTGIVTVAIRDAHSRWTERAFPVGDLPAVIAAYAGQADVYVTQNRFTWGRRIATLLHLDALFADIDYRTVPELAHRSPAEVLDLALMTLQDAGKPAPSFAASSGGGGLYLVWLHRPVPRAALPRWNACQRELWATLRPLGADRRALDAARVLRVIGTRHGRTGAWVEALTAAAPPWPFDTLADEVLPLTRAELHDLRVARAMRRPQKGPQPRPPAGFTVETLWTSRFWDLQTLADVRGWHPIPHGYRDEWIFLAGMAMSWMTPSGPQAWQRELWALARDRGCWEDDESRVRLQAVLKRARMAAAGKTVEWRGRQVDARYYFSTETIIERLAITQDEQRQLTTLLSPHIAKERHRDKERGRKHRTGEVQTDRATYLAEAAARAAEAQRLQVEGLSQRAIAKALGVSQEGVRRMLARIARSVQQLGDNSPCGCLVAEGHALALSPGILRKVGPEGGSAPLAPSLPAARSGG